MLLLLSGGVSLYHDNGFEIHTESATMNVETKVAEGSDPVTGHGPWGTLAGGGFRVEDEGRRVILTDGARVVIQLKTLKNAP